MSKEQEREALILNYGDACYRSGQFPANVALDDHRRSAHEALLAALASPAAEPVQALKPDALQGGLTNEQLWKAFASKLPGVAPDDRLLCVFALGIEYALASPPATKEAKAGVVVTAYALPTNRDISIERVMQMDGSDKWAVRKYGDCLSRTGEWEYEPMPSSRDDGFMARCRFDTAEQAIAALEGAAA